MSRTIACFWSDCSPQLSQSNCYSSLNFASENPFIRIFNSFQCLSELWNALGGCCPKHILHSVTVSSPHWQTHKQEVSPRLLGSESLQPRMQTIVFSKDVKCFAGMHTVVSKETFREKTQHQSSHDFSGSHAHISTITYHWAWRTESFYVEHSPSSICAPSYQSFQKPHSLSCICPHNIPVK